MFEATFRYRGADGESRWHLGRAVPVSDGAGGVVRRRGTLTDVDDLTRVTKRLDAALHDLAEANARLKVLATTDGLTGVENRAAFDERLAEEYERAGPHGRPLSVVLLDVDHFKTFNDSFGHPAGDEVLKAVAATLARTVRGADTAARYGGEEFALVLPETDAAGAMALAERCRRAVAGHAWDRRAVTVSVGVAMLTPESADAAELVRTADGALYRWKQAGRNRVGHADRRASAVAAG